MPAFPVGKLREEFEAGGLDLSDVSVLLLGLTYRPGVEEIRASPALSIASELTEAGASVYGVDPMLDSVEEFDLEPIELSAIYDHAFDSVVSVTPHEEFEAIEWDRVGREEGSVVVDGRQTLDLSETAHRVYTIGGGYDV
jgi:UDP-N-acetyl-D-mannosaminuronic acid dehydrogenase